MDEIHISRGGGTGGSGVAYLPGALFVGLGLLVYFEPQFLVTLVAGLLVLIGLLLLLVAHRLRRGGIAQLMQQRMRGPFDR